MHAACVAVADAAGSSPSRAGSVPVAGRVAACFDRQDVIARAVAGSGPAPVGERAVRFRPGHAVATERVAAYPDRVVVTGYVVAGPNLPGCLAARQACAALVACPAFRDGPCLCPAVRAAHSQRHWLRKARTMEMPRG